MNGRKRNAHVMDWAARSRRLIGANVLPAVVKRRAEGARIDFLVVSFCAKEKRPDIEDELNKSFTMHRDSLDIPALAFCAACFHEFFFIT